MNPFTVIFFHIMTFTAGGMCFLNLAHLTPNAGEGYAYSWGKVAVFVAMGIAFAVGTHLERSCKPKYTTRIERQYNGARLHNTDDQE